MKASTAEKAISYPCDMDDIVLSDNKKYANINLFFFYIRYSTILYVQGCS